VAQLAGTKGAFAGDEAMRAARVDPALMRDRLRDAFREVIAKACATGPVLLVVDDVQWVDAASLRLIDDLVTRGQGPLLVLMLARPELGQAPTPVRTLTRSSSRRSTKPPPRSSRASSSVQAPMPRSRPDRPPR